MVNIRLQPNDIIICSNSLWDKISSGVLKISDVVKQPGIVYSDSSLNNKLTIVSEQCNHPILKGLDSTSF